MIHGAVAVATNNGSLVNDIHKNKYCNVIALMISERDTVPCITETTMEMPPNPTGLYKRHRVVFNCV